VLSGLVGQFGIAALAGYGMGEYLQISLVFGFGSVLVTMVGTNVGDGRRARAERIPRDRCWAVALGHPAGFSRLVIASVGGWMAIHWFDGRGLFGVMVVAFLVFGITVALAVRWGAWRRATPPVAGRAQHVRFGARLG
jgi:hypothetical protein